MFTRGGDGGWKCKAEDDEEEEKEEEKGAGQLDFPSLTCPVAGGPPLVRRQLRLPNATLPP